MTEEKLYTRTVYTQGRQEIVKAKSPEEAKEKFINGHADVKAEGGEIGLYAFSDIFEIQYLIIEDVYGQ